MPTALPVPLRVAIVGGGPGGLGAAIAISVLPDTEVTIYEQARELREIGAGIRIGFNSWKALELLGAVGDVKGHTKDSGVLHRNGLTGELVKPPVPTEIEHKYLPQRVRRTRLQSALISKVPKGTIQLRKRLVSLENLNEGGARLVFEDGTETSADLVIGGDGIRSVVREHTFPDHAIRFTGAIIWRVLIPLSSVSHIPDISDSTAWWHSPSGHVYFSRVDNGTETPPEKQMFEIAARNVINPETATGKRFSWGIPATNERVESHFIDYDPRVRQTLEKVPEGQWKEFAAFAGPRLETLTAWDKVVLIGDASHPLSGAFGSGAAFAMEDGWILARALAHTRARDRPLADALRLFDEIRSPYYRRMYEHLDQQKKIIVEAKAKEGGQTFEEALKTRASTFGGEKLGWIYGNNIEEVWREYLKRQAGDAK